MDPTTQRRRSRHRVVAFFTLVVILLAGPASVAVADSQSEETTFSGTVTGADGLPIVGARIELQRPGVDASVGATPTSDEAGRFSWTSKWDGVFTLKFSCPQGCLGSHQTMWLGDRPTLDDAATFELNPGAPVMGLDARLPTGASISGVVTTTDGQPLPSVEVAAYRPDEVDSWYPAAIATTNSLGEYTLKSLSSGPFIVRFLRSVPDRVYLTEYWPNAASAATAETIDLDEAEMLTGIDTTIIKTSRIDGNLFDEEGSPLEPSWVSVTLFRLESGTFIAEDLKLNEHSGFFWFRGLTSGTYRLCFDPYWTAGRECASESPPMTPPIELLPEAAVALSDVVAGSPVQLTRPQFASDPVVGSSLNASCSTTTTGAVLSYTWFADEVVIEGATDETLEIGPELLGSRITARIRATAPNRHTRVIDSATTYPVGEGTLTASPPVVSGEPIIGSTLSVDPGEWPQGADLSIRWASHPGGRALGSEASVTLAEEDLGKTVSVTVTGSLAGYKTNTVSAGVADPVARGRASVTTPTITGQPEQGSMLTALASSPTPGAELGYVWFIDDDRVPDHSSSTLELDARHVGSRISVLAVAHAAEYLDGTSGRSSQTQPVSASTAVTRLAGADRYATSAAISASEFDPGVPVAYLASGTNFPDALSGAPLAGLTGGPVLLTAPDTLPEVIADELKRLQPDRIVILGGTSVINPVVDAQLRTAQ